MRSPAVLLAAALLPSLPGFAASTLYGVTGSHLVTIDPDTGGTTPIGALNLPAGVTPGPLAWHPGTATLFGLAYDFVVVNGSPVVSNQRFIQINPATGNATTLQNYSVFNNPGYEAIEYVAGSVNSLVISSATSIGSTFTTRLATITTSGTINALVNSTPGIDNDLLAYDSSRGILYSVDPNGTAQVTRLDLASGTHATLAGGLPSPKTGELAYDLDRDRILALDYEVAPPNLSLYRIATAGGTGPVSFGPTVTLAGDQVRGLAFAPIPEPAPVALAAGLLLAGWTGFRLRARHRSPAPHALA